MAALAGSGAITLVAFGCCCRVTEKGNYTELDAAHIIRQILQGVQYLHSHGEYSQAVSGPQDREVSRHGTNQSSRLQCCFWLIAVLLSHSKV